MPVLQFKGKIAVECYHHTIPHHTLEFDAKRSVLDKGEKPGLDGKRTAMVKCATCKRELKDEAQRFCNECSRGFGKKPGEGTPGSPGRTAARRRRRRGR